MKLLIVCSLIAVALVPLAGASSVNVNSSGYGNCETDNSAYNSNSANANGGVAGVGSASASAGTYCQAYQDFFTGQVIRYSQIGGGASACTAATGCAGGNANWYTSGTYCDTSVSATGAGYNSLGCPAGTTPFVPALLP